MCGIVGVLAKNNYGMFGVQEDSFFQMLYADVLRGADSTGVIAVERHGAFHIAKEAAEASWVIPQIKSESFFKDAMVATRSEGKCWIGHNRKSTVGKTTDDNAHPFVVNDEFALVHNGTLYNHEKLVKGVEVDSQALAIVLHEAMGKDDWKTALEATLGEVNGAYACVWYDQRKGTVNLLRNNQRPLGILETNQAFYWASEPAMAWWILGRNGVKHEEIKHFNLVEHHLVTFDIENSKMEVTELSPKKATAPTKGTSHTKAGATKELNGEVVSDHWTKSGRKNFRNAWVGRRVRFTVEDLVEVDHPKTIEEGADNIIIFGDIDDMLVGHVVRAEVSLGKLGIKYREAIIDRLWSGLIEGIDFDKKTGMVSVWVVEAKPIVVSNIVQKMIALTQGRQKLGQTSDRIAHHPQCACKECKDIDLTKGAELVTKPPFPKSGFVDMAAQTKLNAAVEERVKRMRENYEEAYGELEQRITPQGKIQLVVMHGNKKGEILYETPIALH